VILFLGLIMVYFQYKPSGNIIFLPVFIIVNLISALGVGIWLSALTVRYRDFAHIIPFAVQFGMYATPIAYPSSLVMKSIPDWAVSLYYINPMAGVVEGYRFCILGVGEINTFSYLSFGVVVLLFVTGLYYFRKVERVMADIV
jgi:lipopolysaccharide transport system permease protein